MNKGTCAVALLHGQVVLVQAARSHEIRDGYIDVVKFTSFANGTFVADASAPARISSKNLLSILPTGVAPSVRAAGTLELHGQAYAEFIDIASRNQRTIEKQFSSSQRRGKLAFWR
ncbi:hypothetical protein EXIGLDRAFT_609195 [Exidia glandulosa HHB12029]|uniref:Uncharacterized protein n=1 Tax=Exidia glandulosa HHB12029 TaxID=1314781 RepID=A0A166AYW8_EXIGL|nr:hypothetical protein EXIGLDRAFT_609195 [Exidia glandulosa HHB12029]